LDFYCPGAKLAIELDGGGHNYRAGQIRDRTRSEFLARHGVIVLRFWNHQVRRELDSVLRAIWFALGQRQQNKPSPSSSPFGKGRGEADARSVCKVTSAYGIGKLHIELTPGFERLVICGQLDS
jgi:Protein of unknown function (DUF559)